MTAQDNKTYLIYGVSKGLGKAFTEQLPEKTDTVFGVCRTLPSYLTAHSHVKWISSDLSEPENSVTQVKDVILNQKIDCLIYNVDIWEHNVFTEDFDFSKTSTSEIIAMVQTNIITSCILHIQAFTENLKLSGNGKIILTGSTWGLNNHNSKEVTFSASKFALRGIVHSLRENLKVFNIGVSILNLGYLATNYGFDKSREEVIETTNGTLIPLQDAIAAVRFILATSKASCVKEITMPAMKDTNV